MKFTHPYLLNLLWGLVIAAGFAGYGMYRRRKILSAFLGASMLPAMIPGYRPGYRWLKGVLTIMAAGFGIVALAGPQAGFHWEKVSQKGVDIMIALDCSNSMLAQDIKPSRLARAKREIIDLLRMMRSDRVGLVAFSGKAILQCPLTLDHDAFHIFLNVLAPGFLPVGGTNLDEAVKTCYAGFEKASDTQKAIILITDGETTDGSIEETAKEMAGLGIKIFCVGVGDLQGAPIPDKNGGFKKDGAGNIVLSRVNETVLQQIAAVTGGAYVRSVAGDMDLDLIYSEKILGTMDRKTLVSGKKKVWENRFQWFLLPCVLLLILELMLSPVKRQKMFFILVLSVFWGMGLLIPPPVSAKMISASVREGVAAFEAGQYEKAKKYFIDAQLEDPSDQRLYYNIGAAAYMNNEFELAEKNFLTAARSKDPDIRHRALYNLANTRYRLGRLDDAIDGYTQVVEQFPEDTQAKENLDFVRRKKEEQQQAAENLQDRDKQDKKKDKQDKGKKDNSGSENSSNQTPDNPGRDKPDTDKKDASGRDGKQPEADKKESSRAGGKKQDPPSPGAAPGPEPQDPPSGRQTGEQPEKGDTANSPDPGNGPGRAVEKMLNRLADKPGQAMMPRIQKQYIEKDW